MTTTHAERFSQATRTDRDRKVTYAWNSPTMEIRHGGDTTPYGERVEISFAHDGKRKRYTATARLVHYFYSGSGMLCTMYGLFDSKFPAVVFHNEPCARYSDKSFAKFEAETISLVNDLDSEDTPLARLLARLAGW
jgi:hypothetical protein